MIQNVNNVVSTRERALEMALGWASNFERPPTAEGVVDCADLFHKYMTKGELPTDDSGS